MELRKKPVPPPSPPSPSPSDDERDSPSPPRSSAPPKKLSKILYIDLDLHHGDAVESAFLSSPYTLTLSLHLHAPLFYPSTGSLDSSGPSNPKAAGKGHALNLALESGLGGESLNRVWEVIEKVKESFGPVAVVVQCGVDGLNGDPCKVRFEMPHLSVITNRLMHSTSIRNGTFHCRISEIASNRYSTGTYLRFYSEEEVIPHQTPLEPGLISPPFA
jgi:histone deacetylase 8